MTSVYLAGPDIFFANGDVLIARKKQLAREYGFEPVASTEDRDFPQDLFESGMYISALNEQLMARADFIIANMTPFRGISADVGTAFEIGFMCAQAKPAFGYSNDPRHYNVRAETEFYGGGVAHVEGILRGPDGQMVEEHLMADNLMLDGGIVARGGEIIRPQGGPRLADDDTAMFERVLGVARRFFANRI